MTDEQLLGDWTRNVVLITGPDGKAHGSGFVVRRAGAVSHVVTCAHVVSDLGGANLEANGRPAKVLYDGTADGIDLAVLAAEGLTEEAQTLTRGAQIGDEVFAIGFTRVDRGRRATARPAKIREATQLTYEPAKVKKHPGWLLAVDGDQVTDGFSGGPVVDARTGMVIGVLGLRGTGTADAIAISNLSAWRDAPPAVSPIRDEVAQLKRTAKVSRQAAVVLGLTLAGAVGYIATQRPTGPIPFEVVTPDGGSGTPRDPLDRFLSWSQRDETVIVQASAGWQAGYNTYAKKGQKLCLSVTGQVHVALGDVNNLAQMSRNILAQYAAPGTKLATFKTSYPPPEWSKYNAFRRRWTGPEGATGPDGMLDDCLLRASSGWGALLMVELPVQDDPNDARDPLRVLDELGVALTAVRPLTNGRTYEVTADNRKLAFIVNDAVVSGLWPDARQKICRESLASLGQARIKRAQDTLHRLDLEPPELYAYQDNVGSFQVRIAYGACDESRNRHMMRPTGSGTDAVRIDDMPALPMNEPRDAGPDARRRGGAVTLPP